MKAPVIALVLCFALFSAPCLAAAPKRPVHHGTSHKKRVARVKPHEPQPTFSFLDQAKVQPMPVNLTSATVLPPLTGVVVKQVVKQEFATDTAPNSMMVQPLSPVVVKKTEVVQASRSSHPVRGQFKGFFRPDRSQNKTVGSSWVMPIKDAKALQLAQSIAAFIAYRLPATTSTLLLATPANMSEENPFTQALIQELRKAGFAIASYPDQAPTIHSVQYRVSPLSYSNTTGVLIRLRIDQTEATRWYQHHDDGALMTASPITVKETLP